MRCGGIRDGDVAWDYSVEDAAELLRVDPDLIRTWIDRGLLLASERETTRIYGARLLEVMERFRKMAAEEATLSVPELESVLPIIGRLVGFDAKEMEVALDELEAAHHITIKSNRHDFVVNRGDEPHNRAAKVLKRLLWPRLEKETCLHCESVLPRFLQAPEEERAAYTVVATSLVPETNRMLVVWSVVCPQCGEESKSVSVSGRA